MARRAEFDNDDDVTLLARGMFGEARGEELRGIIGVGLVVMNRIKSRRRYGDTVRKVLLRAWQFSAFNKNDPNLKKLLNPTKTNRERWKICLQCADLVLSGDVFDYTLGATHYHDVSIKAPWWVRQTKVLETLKTRRLLFYANVD